jgi:hypothetical protein
MFCVCYTVGGNKLFEYESVLQYQTKSLKMFDNWYDSVTNLVSRSAIYIYRYNNNALDTILIIH